MNRGIPQHLKSWGNWVLSWDKGWELRAWTRRFAALVGHNWYWVLLGGIALVSKVKHFLWILLHYFTTSILIWVAIGHCCMNLLRDFAPSPTKVVHNTPSQLQHTTTPWNTPPHRATLCFFVALRSQRVAHVSLQGLGVEATGSNRKQWIPTDPRKSHSFTDDSLAAAMAVVPEGGPGGPPAPTGCEVRAANPPKGFGLFACAPCPAYSNLFTEDGQGTGMALGWHWLGWL